jgi:predicted lipoprotein with Yx(FWY)xxD motif
MRQDGARTVVRGRRLRSGARLSLLCAAVLASLALAACSSSSKPKSGGTGGGAPVQLLTKTGADGTYITDSRGVSLYDFVNDTPTSSNCVGACASQWPPLTDTVTAGAGVNGSLITMITRPDGTKQAAYNGHPLYYYAGDGGAGQTNGQGQNLNGGLWWLISPAGDEIKKTG